MSTPKHNAAFMELISDVVQNIYRGADWSQNNAPDGYLVILLKFTWAIFAISRL